MDRSSRGTERNRARLLVLGRQGAGKGTQCARLAHRLGVPHISTGDLFRAEVAAGSQLGRRAAVYLERGALVPDDLVVDLVASRVGGERGARGYILDGFPRTLAQGHALFDVLGPNAVDGALELHVPVEVVLPRLASRRVCTGCGAATTLAPGAAGEQRCATCGGTLERRSDDTEEAIATRLALYDAETGPLLIWLDSRELLATVDGIGRPDEVGERMLAAGAALVPWALGSPVPSPGLADAG